MNDKLAVGVDFGGTKISAGVVNLNTGGLVGTSKKKTRQLQGEDDVVKRLVTVIDEALAEAGVDIRRIEGIGVGAAGMVNREKGILLAAANIGAHDLSLTEPLAKYYGVPCRLGNDVVVATLAEKNFGAGRQCDDFVCIFIGTGIGGGIVSGGNLYYGANGTAGEIGHVPLFPDGRQCNCLAFGCLETYASRTAIAKVILKDLQRGYDSVVRDKVDMAKGILRSKALAQAVDSGDELVTKAVVEAAQYMGMGLAIVINFYNPQRIILGGGLVNAIDLYFDLAQKEARRRALKIPGRKVEIVKAELGDYAGIIGGALLLR
jgi:glucokinase